MYPFKLLSVILLLLLLLALLTQITALITAFWQMPFKHTFSPWLVFPNFKQCSPTSDLIPFFIFALLAFFFLALREAQTKNAHFQILYLLFTTSAKSSPSTKSKNVVILSFISVLPVKLWPHYTLYQLCLCPKIRLWNPFPQVKLHLTLAVSCVLTRYYCKQFEIPRMASCKSHWTDPSIAVHTVSENTTWSVTKDKLWQPQTIFTTFVTTSLGQCPSNPSAQRSHVGDSSPQSKLVTQGTAKYNPFGICFLPLALIHML